MKPFDFLRNTLLFAVPVCVLLTSCTAPQTETDFTPQLGASYTVNAEMTYGENQSAQLAITRMGDGVWEAAFSEPATLAGVVLAFDGNAVSASYKGLAFTVPKSALPAKNMLVLATGALDAAASAGQIPCTQQEDGTWSTAGETEGGSYTMTFTDAGEPAVFDMPSQPLHIVFSGFVQQTAGTESTSAETTTAAPSETTSAQTETVTTAESNTETEGTS